MSRHEKWLEWVDLATYTISQTFIRLLPLFLPMPQVALITVDMYLYALAPLRQQGLNFLSLVISVIAGAAFEFFGASAMDVTRSAQSFNQKHPGENKISSFWGSFGVWSYFLVSLMTITVTGVAPYFKWSDPSTYPVVLQYSFVILVPFGYKFLMTNVAIRDAYEVVKRKKLEVEELEEKARAKQINNLKLQREQEAWEHEKKMHDLELAQRQAEINERIAQSRIAELDAQTRQIRAEKKASIPEPVVVHTNGNGMQQIAKIDWRNVSPVNADQLLLTNPRPVASEGALNDLSIIVAESGSRFTIKEAMAALNKSESSVRQITNLLYAAGHLIKVGNEFAIKENER